MAVEFRGSMFESARARGEEEMGAVYECFGALREEDWGGCRVSEWRRKMC